MLFNKYEMNSCAEMVDVASLGGALGSRMVEGQHGDEQISRQ